MKFSVSKEVIQVAEIIEKSPKLRRILWGIIGAAYLFGLAALAESIKWW